MTSSTTLPVQTTPLPGASAPASGAGSFDRMQAELKAVQQQALATQQALQKLNAHKPVDAYSAVTSALPGFSAVDGAMLGTASASASASALALAGLVVWWYVWHRPSTHRAKTGPERMPTPHTQKVAAPVAPQPAPPSQAPTDESLGWSASAAAGEFSTYGFEPSSPVARKEPNVAFDSEAAASEVVRVRKSLAEKRQVRAHFLEREDATDSARDPDADLDLDLDLDDVHTPAARTWPDNTVAPLSKPEAALAAPVAVEPEPEPEPGPEPEPEPDLDLDLDLHPDPWRQPGETTTGTNYARVADAIHFSLALEDYGMKPEVTSVPDVQPAYDLTMDLSPSAATEDQPPVQSAPINPSALEAKGYDYTITMALAQESAALEMWVESRDLASEVLASDNAALVAQAQALLERLNQMERDAPPDTNWSTMR